MKKFLAKIRKHFLSKKATRNYITACKLAEMRYASTGHTPQYVISAPDNECELMVCSSKEFLEMRKKLGITSKQLTLQQLKRGCWYRTPNRNGMDKLSAKDVMKRKFTYVYTVLDSRGLVEKK